MRTISSPIFIVKLTTANLKYRIINEIHEKNSIPQNSFHVDPDNINRSFKRGIDDRTQRLVDIHRVTAPVCHAKACLNQFLVCRK